MSAPNPRVWNRRLHRWASIAVALPFLVVITTGVLLQLKKQLAWVQPPEQRGVGTEPRVSLEQILAAARSVPQAGVRDWSDVDRLDVRPGKGMVKLQSVNRWEVQVDLQTGAVLQTAYRRSDLLESLHDGSWFHPAAKLGIFLPAGLLVFGLWVTGIYLWLLPHRARRAKGRTRAARGMRPASELGAAPDTIP